MTVVYRSLQLQSRFQSIQWQLLLRGRRPHVYNVPQCRNRTQLYPVRHFSHTENATNTDRIDDQNDNSNTNFHEQIYYSPDSLLVRSLAWIVGAKASVAISCGTYFMGVEAQKFLKVYQTAATEGVDLLSYIEQFGMPTMELRLPLALLGLGGLAVMQLRKGIHSVCTRLSRVLETINEGSDSIEYIDVEHMTMLGHRTVRYPRQDCDCAKPKTLTTHFTTISPKGNKTYYLLPVEGWTTDNKSYLHTFIYERYFRDEPVPPHDSQLIQIDGFGPYRPMQFADPSHPAARRIAWPASRQALTDTPFFVKDGYVYADFKLQPKLTLEEKRSHEFATVLSRDQELREAMRNRQSITGSTTPQTKLHPEELNYSDNSNAKSN